MEQELKNLEMELNTPHDKRTDVYNSFFYATVCHVCKKYYPSLKVCGQCKMISYCGVEHQKQHWPDHRELCKQIKKLREIKRGNLFLQENEEEEDWTKLRIENMVIVEIHMSRELMAYERNMFMFPRVCDVCKNENRDLLKDCSNCYSFSYCSESHLLQIKEIHEKFCDMLAMCFNFDLLGIQPTDYLSIDISNCSSKSFIYDDIEAFVKNAISVESTNPYFTEYETLVLVSEMLSCQLSLLYALNFIGKSTGNVNDSLVIHVVGASFRECKFMIFWEIVLHCIASIKSLEFVFIGPELPALENDFIIHNRLKVCESCTNNNKEIKFDFQCNTLYHDYINNPVYKVPNIITVFNCGFCEYEGSDNDSWLLTLPYLLNLADVMTLITSFTELEAEKDYERLAPYVTSTTAVPIRCQRNPFSSRRPYRDHEGMTTNVFYQNGYLSVFKN